MRCARPTLVDREKLSLKFPIQILRLTVKMEKSCIPELAMPLQPKSDLEKDHFRMLQIIVLERRPA